MARRCFPDSRGRNFKAAGTSEIAVLVRGEVEIDGIGGEEGEEEVATDGAGAGVVEAEALALFSGVAEAEAVALFSGVVEGRG